MSDAIESEPPARGQVLVYQAEDGRVKLEVGLEDETVLAQPTAHGGAVRLDPEATRKKFLQVRLAEREYGKFNLKRIAEADRVGGDFDRAIDALPPKPAPRRRSQRDKP